MREKFKFQAIPRSSSVRWNAKEQSSKGEYVKYGEDNLFPQHLIDLLNNSAIHNTCINAIVRYRRRGITYGTRVAFR